MFTQRRYLTRLSFDLLADAVLVKETRLTSSISTRVPFESISAEPTEVSLISKPALWAMIVTAALSLITGLVELNGGGVDRGIWGFYAILAALSALWFGRSRAEYLVFGHDTKALVVMKNRPTADAQRAFVEEMQAQKRFYFAQRYLLGTELGAAADALHKLAWLRQEGILTNVEFETLKSDIVKPDARAAAPPPIRYDH